jgi:hypothetical protein
MSADECRVADWQALGYRDGAAGTSLDKYADREKSCVKKGFQAQFDPYMAGRQEGLRNFCQPERGFRAALDGYSYAGVCPMQLEAEFLDGYNDGRAAYQAKQAVANIENDINSLRYKLDDYERQTISNRAVLRDSNASAAQKEDAQRRLDGLHYDRAGVEKDLKRARDDLYWRENDLDRVRSDIGLRWGAW